MEEEKVKELHEAIDREFIEKYNDLMGKLRIGAQGAKIEIEVDENEDCNFHAKGAKLSVLYLLLNAVHNYSIDNEIPAELVELIDNMVIISNTPTAKEGKENEQ